MTKDITRLKRSLEGDVLDSAFDRGRYATDASIYQMMPLAVITPRSARDIKTTIEFAQARKLSILPRGAGTSQNGQTVNKALVLDNSVYFNRLLDLDVANMRCSVEPGMVLDTLNRLLKPHGLWFPVDVSTSSRATIGGMVGNNSAGGRSIRYGIMRDNVGAIDAILSTGRTARFGLLNEGSAELESLLPDLLALGQDNSGEIEARFPKVLRRVGGYNLDALLPDTLAKRPGSTAQEDDINLSHLLVGSEGTLAYSAAIELKLSPLPAPKIMALCHFASFYAAMDAAQYLVALDPITVELIDQTMISLARSIPLFKSTVDDYIRNTPEAVLVVEFAEEDWANNLAKIDQLQAVMAQLSDAQAGKPRQKIRAEEAVVVITPPDQQARISEMRKSGLNIMMSMKSEAKPVSFVEDCAVPLQDLADYTQGLKDIFEKYGTSGTWYAHASVGCLHVRPVLNMKLSADVQKMKSIATEAFELVKKYGGSHSGEHGDGLSRSEFNPVMFGPQLTAAFRKLKALFDPAGVFNPGKIVDAPDMDTRALFRFAPGYHVADFPTQLNWSAWPGAADGFQGAVEMCNNNGACRKRDGGVMCPSFRVTGAEKDSTRGRANSLRLAMSGQLGAKALASPEMADTMKLCVSCKACKHECPTGVDMAAMKIETSALYRAENGLSRRDRLIAYLPDYAPIAAALAPLFNLRDKLPGLAWLSQILTGFSANRPLPLWQRRWFQSTELAVTPIGERPVLLFVDTFSRYFEPENLRSAQRVLTAAGFTPFAPLPDQRSRKPLCCGRTHLSVGNVARARDTAQRLVEAYAPYAAAGIPIVGLEPSCLLALKDEIPALLNTQDAQQVAKMVLTFEELLLTEKTALRLKPLQAKALLHGHCHQKAFGVMRPVQEVLGMIEGLEVETIETSCCGMAGAFGYGAETFDISMQMAEARLLPAIRGADAQTYVIADGTSCRSQIKDGAAREAVHVARLLDQQLIKD